MIKTKTFLTMTGILMTTAFAGGTNSHWEKSQPLTVNYSALVRLSENLESLRSKDISTSKEEGPNTTEQIVSVIDDELSQNIRLEKVALEKHSNKKSIIAKALPRELSKEVSMSQGIAKVGLKKFGDIEIDDYQAVDREEKKSTQKPLESLAGLEINNSELVEIEVSKQKASVSLKKFESTIDSALVKDEVVTGQSSTRESVAPIEADEVKTIQQSVEKKNQDPVDDLIIYDYSKKKNKSQSVSTHSIMSTKPLSQTVQKAISREMGHFEEKVQPITHEDLRAELNLSDEATIYDYAVKKSSSNKIPDEEVGLENIIGTATRNFHLKAKQVFLDTHKVQPLNGFDFVSDYDRSDRISDDTTGDIGVEYSLSGSGNVLSGVVSSQGMIPVRVEMNLNTQKGLVVPLINEQSIQKFLQDRAINIEGNLVIVSLHDDIRDVEVDAQYQKKFWFDKNLKELPSRDKAELAMIAGVKTGNLMLRYLIGKGDIAQKLIFIGEGEAYYEDPGFEVSGRQTFELYSKNILSSARKELNLDPSKLVYFNTNQESKKRALNAYELRIPTLPYGMRKYLDLKIFDEPVFVGTESKSQIEVPTREYIEKIMEKTQVSSLKDRCLVQLNLTKDIKEIKAGGKNRSGEMFLEVSSMDRDGVFSSDNVELAEKIFLAGDQEGLISAKLEYSDGSIEFLKTYCSEGTYLIEQL